MGIASGKQAKGVLAFALSLHNILWKHFKDIRYAEALSRDFLNCRGGERRAELILVFTALQLIRYPPKGL